MQLFTICATTVTALAGQLTHVQKQRLQYDLSQQREHRRQIQAAIARINRMPLYYRSAAIKHLKDAVFQLQLTYGVERRLSKNAKIDDVIASNNISGQDDE